MDVRSSGLQLLWVAGVLSREHKCPAWSEHGDVASTPHQRGEEGQGAPALCGKVCFGGKAVGGLGVVSRGRASPRVPHHHEVTDASPGA